MPLALIIATSPLSVIPAVLVLHTPRPKPAGLAFLAGWVVGLAALTVVFVGLSDLLGGGLDRPPSWASWLRIALGAALIVFGIWQWFTRHRSPHSPGWLRAISSITPARAGGAGS
jgi:protein-S-isoprenylcysteine O-methyltransferase Ste14